MPRRTSTQSAARLPSLLLGILLALGLAQPHARAAGAVWCVAPAPVATAAPCANGEALPTIQAAVTLALPGDEIRLARGTYSGAGPAAEDGGALAQIDPGNGRLPAYGIFSDLLVVDNEAATGSGGGISMTEPFELRSSTVANNVAGQNGGGVAMRTPNFINGARRSDQRHRRERAAPARGSPGLLRQHHR